VKEADRPESSAIKTPNNPDRAAKQTAAHPARSTIRGGSSKSMTEDEFLKQRVDDQIGWYDKKSQWNQKWYKWLRIIEILAAMAIPFLTGYITPECTCMKIIVGLLGLVIAIITAVVSLYHFQENWIEYRTTCESLRHEKFLFLTKTEPYNIVEPFALFVQRIESLISTENTKWSQLIKSPKKEKENG
jgi:hypothetical protein